MLAIIDAQIATATAARDEFLKQANGTLSHYAGQIDALIRLRQEITDATPTDRPTAHTAGADTQPGEPDNTDARAADPC